MLITTTLSYIFCLLLLKSSLKNGNVDITKIACTIKSTLKIVSYNHQRWPCLEKFMCT